MFENVMINYSCMDWTYMWNLMNEGSIYLTLLYWFHNWSACIHHSHILSHTHSITIHIDINIHILVNNIVIAIDSRRHINILIIK